MSTNSNLPANGNKPGLSSKQKELMKKYAVFVLMGIIFAGCIWFIFAPSADEKAKRESQSGFNTDIPMPKEGNLFGDKRVAYEQDIIRQRQSERMRSLQDFSAMLGDNNTGNRDEIVTLYRDPDPSTPSAINGNTPPSRQQSSIQASTQTYRDVNRTMGSFYERPREDPEKVRMREELEELKKRISETEIQAQTDPVENRMALMERSFQMAAKYIPEMTGGMNASGTMGMQGTAVTQKDGADEPSQTAGSGAKGKTAVVPVTQARTRTVSALLPEMSDAEFFETYSRSRNMAFLTPTAETGAGTKNTVSACIHTDQTIMNGQNVRIRLLEPMQAGNAVIPRNTLLTGTARIQNERLGISIVSLEHAGTVLFISLRVYDLDGQQGIFIPNLQELNAAKEIIANMGTNAGTSINLSNDAEKQFIADMGRNVIQGVSQFTAKKLREVKVHLKDGYRVYLFSE